MVAPLRIAFFGTPQFAVPTLQRLLASRHPVVGVVTQPDRGRGRGQKVTDAPVKTLALEHGVPVFQPERLRLPDVRETIGAWRPDLGVVAAYGKIIPEELLELPRLGMINVHASLLPKYRGAAPVHRAIIDGEVETGVTIMRLVRELDAGDMIAKIRRPIGPDDTSAVVERDLAGLGAALLVEVVDRLAEGPVAEERQDFMMASYAPRLTKEEGLVDWTLPASFIHNRVRGLYPWPHAYTYLDGHRLILLQTRVEDEPASESPGTVLAVTRDTVHVATGHEGRLAILQVQPEGRRPMSVRDFLAGHPIRPGTRLGADK
jgi:methionyl-tRNA formyltransferase